MTVASVGEFALALIVFLAAHVLPRATGFRDAAIARIGQRSYLFLYSIVSTGLLAWLILATLRAPFLGLWGPSPATAHIALGMMLPACVLLMMALPRPNALSVAFKQADPDLAAPGVLGLTRHPILWAFLLWASAHVVANGDLIAVTLFSGMALFSVIGMGLMDRRARQTMGEARWEETVDALRKAGPSALLSWRCLIEAFAGMLLYVALLHLHAPVIGVDPLASMR